MANPIMALLGKINPAMQAIAQMFGIVKTAKDPQAMINQLSQNDPRMQEVLNVVQQNGGNAKGLFYSLAKQRGVDPEMVLQQVRSMMK